MHLVSSARFSYFLRRIERRERLCHLSKRFPRTISLARLPTAPASVHISPGRFSSLPIPVEHLSRRDATVNAVPRSSGTLASLAKQSSKLSQSIITQIGKCSSFHLSGDSSLPITTSHNIAGVYSARSRASRHAIASTPKVDKMVLFEALLFQVMKESGVASVGK